MPTLTYRNLALSLGIFCLAYHGATAATPPAKPKPQLKAISPSKAKTDTVQRSLPVGIDASTTDNSVGPTQPALDDLSDSPPAMPPPQPWTDVPKQQIQWQTNVPASPAQPMPTQGKPAGAFPTEDMIPDFNKPFPTAGQSTPNQATTQPVYPQFQQMPMQQAPVQQPYPQYGQPYGQQYGQQPLYPQYTQQMPAQLPVQPPIQQLYPQFTQQMPMQQAPVQPPVYPQFQQQQPPYPQQPVYPVYQQQPVYPQFQQQIPQQQIPQQPVYPQFTQQAPVQQPVYPQFQQMPPQQQLPQIAKPAAPPKTEPTTKKPAAKPLSDIERVSRMEKITFGKVYTQEEVADRVDRLETKVFGKPKDGVVHQRISILEKTLKVGY